MPSRTSQSRAVRELYKSRSLDDIRHWAFASRNDKEFAAFHKRTLEALFQGFKVDFLAISIIRVDERLQPIGGFDCVLLGLDPKIIANYEKIADTDVIAPVIYSNPGRIIPHTAALPDDAFLDHRFFRGHCRIFDIRRSLMIGLLCPGHARKFLTIEYLGSPENHSWEGFDADLLELATFPFALAWLSRKGAMDDAMLEQRFTALAGLTAADLAKLRLYVNSPYRDLADQAAEIGRPSHGGYKNGLYALRNKLAVRFDWDLDGDGARRSMRPLDADYAFMRMLGDPTAALVLP